MACHGKTKKTKKTSYQFEGITGFFILLAANEGRSRGVARAVGQETIVSMEGHGDQLKS
jgi:hypothetical protein